MDGPVPSWGERVRLDETWHRAPELCPRLSRKPQELAVHRTSAQSHPTGTQPSLFSTFLHPTPNGCLLQLALLRPFLLHFPPTSHSHPALFYHLFSTSLSAPCFPWQMPSTPASDQCTSPGYSSCKAGTVCCSLCTGHNATQPCSWLQWLQQTQLRMMTAFASPAVTAQKYFPIVWADRLSHRIA